MALAVVDLVSQCDIEGTGLAMRVAKITPDNSWLAAGESLTAADLQLGSIHYINAVQDAPTASTAVHFAYDHTNSKLMAFRTDQADDFLEPLPDTTDISATVIRVFAIGARE